MADSKRKGAIQKDDACVERTFILIIRFMKLGRHWFCECAFLRGQGIKNNACGHRIMTD